ncbi:PREDICTED: U4/U6.U5 tri-snRNP-associated protein 1 [Dufourea novaeangliae]|uniref:U4/U6.U5 tri-snRNP-associated protein 1 n=1 Tax=Dufourea novaeangliae TaxID=178035 RepID=A0A154PJC7_DUFNO|nr:PREDICTED: U4/U6.U5 tri-snRNP-associated protein 1 [Dufourea novaeangliae]KZC11927.1 U4/U6.U5 tri-snRNP-associated protein 1 [Dufourea novaeangliae]
MGSNKRHKAEKSRDVKKKRHRSRSRSYTPEREKSEKHRHHKKHRRKERKDYDSDVEIVNAPPPPKISKSLHPSTPPPPEISKQRSPSPSKGGAAQTSLSIEETNKLRAKLGLKPLEVDSTSKDDPNKIKDDLGEFYHKPAPDVNEKLKTQKLKEKISTQKQKRQIEANLAKVKSLGDFESDDDTKAWIDKTRRLEEEKKKAEERAKMLDQLDEEFGIGNLVKEEMHIARNTAYTAKNLKGLKVEHSLEKFEEGKAVILTLKDQEVLNEGEDVLVNVNITDEERYQRNILNKTKKPGYDAYDDDNFDEYGFPKKTVLEKYDEEIEGEKKDNFVLGMNNKDMKQSKLDYVKQRLANKRLESLQLAEPKLASEYYNDKELAKFKKPKKKVRKIRKKLKADDLITEDNDYLRDLGSRRSKRPDEVKDNDTLDVDDLGAPTEDLSGIKLEEDDKELELQLALKKAQRSKESHLSNIEQVVETLKQEPTGSEENQSGYIVLNATAEFCRTLGDIPTYGLAGNREENGQELMDFEFDGVKEEPPANEEEDDGRGAWNTVQLDEGTSEPVAMEAAILDAEPSLGHGVGGALKLAMSKGYLQKEDSSRPSASRFAHLQAQNYSIEDKTYGDDDKFGRRDRFNGPTSDFKEKDGFKPNVKLEYIDDDGHVLSAKEAFRYLSHKFHGKGPGKNKVEKRMKKAEQEVLMKRMSSTDTPLGTLNLLQAKQKETQSPYIVLSGSKQMQTTSISKSKH